MSNIATNLIKSQLTDKFYAQATERLGVNPTEGKALVDQAMPALLNGLLKNAESKAGAARLLGALKSKKHDGVILDSNEDFFAAAHLDEGDKILKHILGDTRDDIAQALALETKTELSQAKKTLAALSPLVMGALGKAVQSNKLNADQVGDILKLALKEKDFAKVGHRIATLMWDKNNNGQYKDDLFEMGKRWVAKLLSNKK